MMNYNNPYPNIYGQSQQVFYKAIPVSSIDEVKSTPAEFNGNPTFFFNKAKAEVYMKQYDNTGNAPIVTFKLVIPEVTEPENPYSKDFKVLIEKIDSIKKLLTPEVLEKADKKHKGDV